MRCSRKSLMRAITAVCVREASWRTSTSDFEKREGLLFVGGFAHPPNADAVLWFAKEIFPLIRQKLDVNFYVVGSKVTDEIKALEQPGSGIIVKGFVTEEELVISLCDIPDRCGSAALRCRSQGKGCRGGL